MMSEELDVSVVIPTYNGKEVLQKTLKGILCQTYPREGYEVIVVDDGSTDGTEALFGGGSRFDVQDLRFLRYVRLAENRGRAVARNVGIQRARGKVVIFLDGDNVPGRELVRAHRALHREEERTVGVGNISLCEDALKSRFGRFWNGRYVGHRKGVCWDDLPFYFPGTGNGSVKRKHLLETGGFDEGFQHYGGEDEELWYRLCVKGGLRNVFVREAVSWHMDRGFSYQRMLDRMKVYGRFAAPIILQKHPAYFETGIFTRHLEPVDFKSDRWGDILRKGFIAMATSPPHIDWIEKLTKHLEFNSHVPFPDTLYGLMLCRYYRLGVRERVLSLEVT